MPACKFFSDAPTMRHQIDHCNDNDIVISGISGKISKCVMYVCLRYRQIQTFSSKKWQLMVFDKNKFFPTSFGFKLI